MIVYVVDESRVPEDDDMGGADQEREPVSVPATEDGARSLSSLPDTPVYAPPPARVRLSPPKDRYPLLRVDGRGGGYPVPVCSIGSVDNTGVLLVRLARYIAARTARKSTHPAQTDISAIHPVERVEAALLDDAAGAGVEEEMMIEEEGAKLAVDTLDERETADVADTLEDEILEALPVAIGSEDDMAGEKTDTATCDCTDVCMRAQNAGSFGRTVCTG